MEDVKFHTANVRNSVLKLEQVMVYINLIFSLAFKCSCDDFHVRFVAIECITRQSRGI